MKKLVLAFAFLQFGTSYSAWFVNTVVSATATYAQLTLQNALKKCLVHKTGHVYASRDQSAIDALGIALVSYRPGDDLQKVQEVFVNGRMAKAPVGVVTQRGLLSAFNHFIRSDEYTCVGIEVKGQIVGVILHLRNIIKWIVIDREHQGKGYARHAIDMFAQENCLKEVLLIPLNLPLAEFYVKKCGFVKVEEGWNKGFYVKRYE